MDSGANEPTKNPLVLLMLRAFDANRGPVFCHGFIDQLPFAKPVDPCLDPSGSVLEELTPSRNIFACPRRMGPLRQGHEKRCWLSGVHAPTGVIL